MIIDLWVKYVLIFFIKFGFDYYILKID